MKHSLLIGDPFLTQEKAKSLIQVFEKETKGNCAQQIYHLSHASMEKILTEARSLPFLAQAQIFQLKGAETLKKGDLEIFENSLGQIPEVTVLIVEAFDLSKNHSLVKLFGIHGEVFWLEEEDKKSLTGRFIKQKLEPSGKTITPGAMALLEERVGDAPVFLDSILSQLINYTGDKKQITEDMVELLAENWQEVDAFKWMDAISRRQTDKALSFLKALVGENEFDILPLLGLLHWQLRRFWVARTLLEEGKSEQDVYKRCRVYPKQIHFFKRQLKMFSREKLESALEGLFELDWKMKTGQADGPLAMESWVIRVTST
ncbi:MAG: DNA polymerase III subunit delta [Candidatus Omnitrophica bacterium]|nr:DNA polymerase III subunit delta [Candidatus Omnitrophota bacterium]